MRALFLMVMAFMVQLNLNAQLSKVHYLPPVAYSDIDNAIPDEGHYFYISTPSTASVTVNIIAVGVATTTIEVSNSIPHVELNWILLLWLLRHPQLLCLQ